MIKRPPEREPGQSLLFMVIQDHFVFRSGWLREQGRIPLGECASKAIFHKENNDRWDNLIDEKIIDSDELEKCSSSHSTIF